MGSFIVCGIALCKALLRDAVLVFFSQHEYDTKCPCFLPTCSKRWPIAFFSLQQVDCAHRDKCLRNKIAAIKIKFPMPCRQAPSKKVLVNARNLRCMTS